MAPPRWRQEAEVAAAVAAGGFLGALARHGVGLAWPPPPGGVPWSTLAVNTSGALALGVLLAWLLGRWPTARRTRALLCTGAIGSWTTMSTLAVELAGLGRDGDVAVAAAYAALTVVLGLAAGALGLALGTRLGRA